MMQIFVRTQSGNTITLAVNDTDTVKSTKRKIATKDGLPVYRQSLVYNGRVMRDEHLLQDWLYCQEREAEEGPGISMIKFMSAGAKEIKLSTPEEPWTKDGWNLIPLCTPNVRCYVCCII